MARDDKVLFYSGDQRAALQHQAKLLVDEVERAPEDHLLHVDEDEWVKGLVERYQVNVPILHQDKWWLAPPVESARSPSIKRERFVFPA